MSRGVSAGLLLLLTTGCNVAHEAWRNLHHEPALVWNQWLIHQRLEWQAHQAWKRVRDQYPDAATEFREGFIDGYVDYLDRGGPPHLPAVPPSRYTRQARYYTPEGHARLQQYFLGFQAGQQEAIASGQRQYLTVPVLLSPAAAEPPPFQLASPRKDASAAPLPEAGSDNTARNGSGRGSSGQGYATAGIVAVAPALAPPPRQGPPSDPLNGPEPAAGMQPPADRTLPPPVRATPAELLPAAGGRP
ncbi:MAG: hypothetical protein NZ703_09270 [Gemmataceae bacterium]|nr:hypothetical protein [Gemmataceae bacterium]